MASVLLGVGQVVDVLLADIGLRCRLGNVQGWRCRFWCRAGCRPSMGKEEWMPRVWGKHGGVGRQVVRLSSAVRGALVTV